MSPEKIATPKGPSASTRSTRHTSPSKISRRSASPTKPKATPSKVRRKLEKTSITPAEDLQPIGENAHSEDGTDDSGSVKADEKETTTKDTNGARGRIRRKRSFEEVAKEVENEEEEHAASKHSRKRSKEHVNGDEDAAKAADSEEDVLTNGTIESKAGADEEVPRTSEAQVIVDKVVDMVNDPALTPPREAEDTGKGAISAADEPPAVAEAQTTPTKTDEKAAEAIHSAQTSPKGKRSREEYDEDHKVEVIETPTEPAKVADLEAKHDAAPKTVSTPAGEEPGSKRAREDVPDSASTTAHSAELPEVTANVCQAFRACLSNTDEIRSPPLVASPTHLRNLDLACWQHRNQLRRVLYQKHHQLPLLPPDSLHSPDQPLLGLALSARKPRLHHLAP